MEGEWSASRSGCFTPGVNSAGAHRIGGWVGPRAVLDAVVKRKIPSPRQESKPRTLIVQPVAQPLFTVVEPPSDRFVHYRLVTAVDIVSLRSVKHGYGCLATLQENCGDKSIVLMR
jgi:hypothetical protein